MPPHILDGDEQTRIVGCLKHVFQQPRLAVLRTGLRRRDQAEAQPEGVVGFRIGGEICPGSHLAA